MIRIPSVPPGVYAMTPDGHAPERILAGAKALLQAGAVLLQLRSKHLDRAQRLRLGRALRPLCAEHSVPLIINDDPTLAAEIGADGVHLGRDDGDVESARRLLGPDAWIGVSCYADGERALRLAAAGASYVAFGAVYPSASKDTPHRAPLTLFRDWPRAEVPTVAIGGLSADNVAPVRAAGARWLAMIGALWGAPDPAAALRRIHALIPLSTETLNP